jgi:hypothetical protein
MRNVNAFEASRTGSDLVCGIDGYEVQTLADISPLVNL